MRVLVLAIAFCSAAVTQGLVAQGFVVQEPVAQDRGAPLRFVPKDSLFVVRASGPAVWRDSFAKTQVMKLLEGEALVPLFAELGKHLDEMTESARAEGKIDIDAVHKAVHGYSGEMLFALRLDWDSVAEAIDNDAPPQLAFVLAVGPDGHTDLAALAEMIGKAAEQEGQWLDLTVGGHRLRVGGDDDMQVALPFVQDGSLVMLAGNDLENQAALFLEAKETMMAGDLRPGQFALHLDAAGPVAKVIEIVADKAEQRRPLPFDLEQLLADMGLGAIGSLDMSLGADGKHVTSDIEIKLTGKDLGLFGMMTRAGVGAPKLLGVVPPAADYYSVSAFDLDALYRTIEKVWGRFEGVAPMSMSDAEEAFAQAFKVRIKEDLLDHVGTELLQLQDVDAQLKAIGEADDDESGGAASMLQGSCFCLQLKDGKAFGEAVEKMVRSRGLHAGRKSEDYLDNKVYKLTLGALVQLEYAITDSMLLLSFGGRDGGAQHLRAVLDEAAARAAGKAPAEPRASISERLSRMPAGWNGVSVVSATAMLDAVMFGMNLAAAEAPEDAPFDIARVTEIIGKVSGELKRLGLDTMVGTAYADRTSLRVLQRW